MTKNYRIYYDANANADQVAALARTLTEMGPGPVTHDRDKNTFDATLAWKSGSLKQHLNRAARIVVAAEEARSDGLAIDSTYWNRAFTDLIRQTTQTAWGNWTLDPSIVPGAVGFISPATGSFTPVATLPNTKAVTLKSPQAWVLESSSVRQTQSEVDFKGGYFDPSSGTEVKVGLDVAWTFSQEGSITSNATMTGRSLVDDFGTVMAENFEWLLQKAASVGYADGRGGIRQGFGVITHVQLCQGGVNIGALNKDSSFSLTGSIDGVNAMTGGGKVDASVKGSYKEINKSKAFESHMWPVEADKVPPNEIALVYQFATYHGKQIMPTWIQPVDTFRVVFDNANGGTYIGNCVVEYSRPGSDARVKNLVTVPGGQVRTLDGIPLDAYDLNISIHFTAGDDHHFPIDSPIATLLTGQCTIDMGGVWPWGSKAKIREAYNGL